MLLVHEDVLEKHKRRACLWPERLVVLAGRHCNVLTLHIPELSEGRSHHPAIWGSTGDECPGLALLVAGSSEEVQYQTLLFSWHRQLKRRV